jgi:hypothetical protein
MTDLNKRYLAKILILIEAMADDVQVCEAKQETI